MKTEKWWHWFFEWSLIIKALNGVWQTFFGIFVLHSNKEVFNRLIYFLGRRELSIDPNDKLMNFLLTFANNISNNTKIFIALYILFHGLLNLFVVIQLYRNRLWAYIFSIWIIYFLMLYQIYRAVVHHSLFLALITIFDGLFIILVWHEYKRKKILLTNKI